MPQIVLSDDHMEASLIVNDGERADASAVLALLGKHGVIHGLDYPCIAAIGAEIGPQSVVVARGTPSRPPVDARIDFAFPTGRVELRPQIGEDGRADFRNLGLVTSVQPGQVLARRMPPQPPAPGTTVLGRLVQPAFPKDAVLLAGPGAAISEDGQTIVAAIAGNPYLDASYVTVRPEIRIYGNVDLSTGNISFEGDVTINGHVETQMEVQATGSVFVRGNATGAVIKAGGDVRVVGGALRQTRIEAGGDVTLRFAEHAAIRGAGSLFVEENLLHSETRVRLGLLVGGSVLGGNVEIGDGGDTRVLGARMGTPTSLRLLPAEADTEALEAVQQERAKVRASLVDLTPKVRRAQEELARAGHQPHRVETLRKMLELAKLLQERDLHLAARERNMAPRSHARARVVVRDTIFPGVFIQIRQAMLRTSSTVPACTLVEGETQVRLLPFT